MFLVIRGLIRGFYERFKSLVNLIWNNGINDLISNRRIGKTILDLIIFGIWVILMFSFPENKFVITAGVAIFVLLLNNTLKPEGGSLFSGFVGPFVTMTTVRLAPGIFNATKIIVAVFSFFLIPAITREVEEVACETVTDGYCAVPPKPQMDLIGGKK